MNRRYDKYLCAKYPQLFRDRHADMKTTLMCWGFECGDGWFPLINKLCKSLMWDGTNYKNKYIRENPPVVVQVKEKFGGLRFYADNCTEKDQALISFAESLSYSVCEVCGATKGVKRTQGWIRSLCPEHIKEYL